jgi:DNA gyrase subunit A
VFQLRAHEVPDSSRQARGTPLINLIEIEANELVTAVVATPTFDKDFMLLATVKGEIKKTPLKEFESVRRAGLIAMGLESGDELAFAGLAKDNDDVIMVSAQGKAIRFNASELRSASRMSGGVRGMRLQPQDDQIVGLETVQEGAMLLTTSETGLGKRTDFSEYPPKGRGGQGVITHNVTARTGRVASARAVMPGHELILMSEHGIVMRTTVDSIAKVGRSTQGVHVMGVTGGDRVACVATIDLSKAPPAIARRDPASEGPDEGLEADDNGDEAGAEDEAPEETPKPSNGTRARRNGGSNGNSNGRGGGRGRK